MRYWPLLLLLAFPTQAAEFTASVERIKALTGPNAPADMRGPDICGTDLGTIAEQAGRLVFAFGDTFGYDNGACRRFGPNWRSNVIGFSTDTDPADGIAIENWLEGVDGKAVAATEGAHQRAFSGEQTRIPTAMVAIGDRLYLHYMSVHGFAAAGGVWDCNWSRFIYSDDGGKSWTEAPDEFGGKDSNFNMLALSLNPRDLGHLYALGTKCGRFGAVRAGRVPVGSVLDPVAWQYYDGTGWVADPEAATDVVPPIAGEGSLVWNAGLGKWMYSTLNQDAEAIQLRLAGDPWGAWGEPIEKGRGKGYAQIYGAFMTPSWISADGHSFYFVMSQFGPYNAYVMKATLR